ncbi:molybdate ABC transporter substrate-binding protein [Labilibaculum filiforme]|uniref:Molybdate-binding protein ModA n=1 Tax=Labilibaculum filiforme TaxID=1940526 RepID=A0A2N3HT43_9BACT|nr:molybdate ABC transporter substrate-binding protein [Labilibaculum filiforme]PKQ61230.1 molybdate ABC transporter substrate-binding protein [Labilibaculum filiforme]
MKLFLNIKTLFPRLLLSCFLLSCSSSNKPTNTISVFAAASVLDVMTEIADAFKAETGISVRLNFASSGILARQIENGASFDYYISASKDWMDYLDSLQLVDRHSIQSLVENRMVAIVPIENTDLYLDSVSIINFPDVFKGRISIGDPAHVPAGKYARQILITNRWESRLADRLLPAKNVRDALFMVEMGEVEMGMVYLSDAKKSKKVRIVYEFALTDCEPMRYYGAKQLKSNEKLQAFSVFLNQGKVKSIWKKNGFKVD